MEARVLTGSKAEIAAELVRLSGEVREAVVFVDERLDPVQDAPAEDIFAEMEPFTVRVGGVDYSRENLYTRMNGE